MKTIAIIQARISSTRLNSKALLNLSGKPMICHVIERTKAIKGIEAVMLATGKGEKNHPLLDIASQSNIEFFAGPEDNVLERFFLASKDKNCSYIIRVTGDNPLTDFESASMALEYALETNADHAATLGIPLGTGVEVVKKSALQKAYESGHEPHHKEHVTPYIKEHPELFKIVKYQSPLINPYPNLRLTVDTLEDYKLMEIIYNELYHSALIKLKDVIDLIKRKPEIQSINSNIKQRPMTHHANE
ncbi:MAG: glycosyltransferase family protein [Spirochaetes bacterium]|nr:glycosyltransferase family protein [Spirochaetota bacterium]